MTVTDVYVGIGKTTKQYHMGKENLVLPCFLLAVKLLRLGCRSRVYGLRRVYAVLVFYNSFGSHSRL
jgi:hypothetical protein